MKIKKIESEQFAGIKGVSVDFKDNLNVIYGKNESGKSTIIDLIYSMFFQNASLDKRTDRDFIANSFPHSSDGTDKNFIEGKITIENDAYTYSISKEWATKNAVAKMIDANGNITKDENEINKILKDILIYGEGVYRNIVFTSQKIQQNTLESIFGECKKGDSNVRDELHGILMQSVATLGGADIDAIENKINEKLKELGNHFDIKTMAPEGGIKKEWKKEVGTILAAYYKLNNLHTELNDVIKYEDNIDTANKEKKELNEELTEIQNALNGLASVETIFEKKKNIQGNYNYQKEFEENAKRDLKAWEDFEKDKTQLEKQKCDEVLKEDLQVVETANNIINKNESILSALTLSAKVDNKSDKKLKISNIDSGKEIIGNNGEYDIKGCTEINLDGIINIKLFPKDVDVDRIKTELDENRSKVNDIYKKHQVDNIDELNCKFDKYSKFISQKEYIDNNYKKFIIQYEEKYSSIDGLKNSIEKAKVLQEELHKQISEIKIPEMYEGIKDFDAYKRNKQERISTINKDKEIINDKLQEYRDKLAGRDSESLKEQIKPLKDEYDNLVAEYKHYEYIYQVFNQIKQTINIDPMSGIDNLFENYLGIISNHSITTKTCNDNVIIASKNNKLTFNTLSKGTKETIGLAFKLAVIENLFKEGGGLAIFDDSFTDLDEDRRNEICKLIERFSLKNQVIFVTCDKVYLGLFTNANVINI